MQEVQSKTEVQAQDSKINETTQQLSDNQNPIPQITTNTIKHIPKTHKQKFRLKKRQSNPHKPKQTPNPFKNTLKQSPQNKLKTLNYIHLTYNCRQCNKYINRSLHPSNYKKTCKNCNFSLSHLKNISSSFRTVFGYYKCQKMKCRSEWTQKLSFENLIYITPVCCGDKSFVKISSMSYKDLNVSFKYTSKYNCENCYRTVFLKRMRRNGEERKPKCSVCSGSMVFMKNLKTLYSSEKKFSRTKTNKSSKTSKTVKNENKTSNKSKFNKGKPKAKPLFRVIKNAREWEMKNNPNPNSKAELVQASIEYSTDDSGKLKIDTDLVSANKGNELGAVDCIVDAGKNVIEEKVDNRVAVAN